MNVDDDLCIPECFSYFSNPVGSTGVIVTRHNSFESCPVYCINYSFVIGGNDYTRNFPSGLCLLGDPTNHWLSGDFEQSLTGQADRLVACRDDCDSFYLGIV